MELKLLDKEIEEDMPDEIRLIRQFYFKQKDMGCKNGGRHGSK